MTTYNGNKKDFTFATDGVNHINIWSGGKTSLGPKLSHFAPISLVHPYLGFFACMEGIWYYVRSAVKDDALRYLVGFEAKKHGKQYTMRKFAEFHSVIMDANYHKLIQNPNLYEEFVNSELPFDHYYMFGKGKVQVRPTGFDFLVEGWEDLRVKLKAGEKPEPLDYEDIFGRLYCDREA